MAKSKSYDYRQSVLLPVSLEDQLMPGTLEFAIHTLVEKRLDMSIFHESIVHNPTLLHPGAGRSKFLRQTEPARYPIVTNLGELKMNQSGLMFISCLT